MSAQYSKERLGDIVTSSYIRSKLRPSDRDKTETPLDCGEGLSDATYADWIVENAKGIFYILVQIDLPHRIFSIVDQALDDDDLPFQPITLVRAGFSDQERHAFTRVQVLIANAPQEEEEEEEEEGQFAIEVLPPMKRSGPRFRLGATYPDDLVRIVGIRSRVFTRRCIPVAPFGDEKSKIPSAQDFQLDIDFIKSVSHQHIVTLRTVYIDRNLGYVLLSPPVNLSLRNFFAEPPKTFYCLPLYKQHEALFNWPHCLASALQFLHNQELHHGRVLPSNIFIDSWNRVFLGFGAANSVIQCHPSKDKNIAKEAYNYGAGEEFAQSSATTWKSAITGPRMSTSIDLGRSKSRMSTISIPTQSEASSSDMSFEISSRLSSNMSSISSPPTSRLSFQSSIPETGDFPQPTNNTELSDRRPADVFSLACVTLDIFTYALKGELPRSPSWSKRTRRGDASAHANVPITIIYVTELDKLAASSLSDSAALSNGIRMLTSVSLLERMLDSNPATRPSMFEVMRCLEDVMIRGMKLSFMHCGGGGLI